MGAAAHVHQRLSRKIQADPDLCKAITLLQGAYSVLTSVVTKTGKWELDVERPGCIFWAEQLTQVIEVCRRHERRVGLNDWNGWARGMTEGNASLAHAFSKRVDLPPLRIVEAAHIDPAREGDTTDARAIVQEAWVKWKGLWCPQETVSDITPTTKIGYNLGKPSVP